MIGRIVWLSLLAALALLTSALQIDKQAEFSPELAALVPQPLRNYAQVPIVKSALVASDPKAAVTEAERLVRRRPIPAEYLTLLAAGQAQAGQLEEATKTIQIAGKRGWRVPVAQHAVLRLALTAGDKSEAARRYAALFLEDKTPNALLLELGPAVLDEPGGQGQQALIDIVAGGERWHALFLRRGPRAMPPAAFAAIAAGSMREGAAFDCKQLAQGIKVLEQRDQKAAQQLAVAAGAGRCPQLAPKESRPL